MTFTDNWANELLGGKAAATATPKDRTPNQKAANVAEQSMGPQTSQTPSGPVDTGTLVGLDSFAEWRDTNPVVDVNEKKAELRHKIANQELEVQAAHRDRVRKQKELEQANAIANELAGGFYRSFGGLVASTASGAARGASAGASGAAIGGLKGAATSGVKSYDAYSQLNEKRKEAEILQRSVSWFEKYVDKEREKLRSIYDELDQLE